MPKAARTPRKRPEGPTPEEKLVQGLIELMEAGVAPWRREWSGEFGGHHCNLFSGHRYRGVNPAILAMGGMMRGSVIPYWCGFNEAKSHGLFPRKGSKAVHIFRPQPVTVADEENPENSRSWMSYRAVPVFNVADLEGEGLQGFIDARSGTESGALRADRDRHDNAGDVLMAWPVKTLFHGYKACYSPTADTMIVPPMTVFDSEEAFYATWAHEAVHSTGHSSRLDRNMGGSFGDKLYAREELVAELGAVLLGDRLEVGSDTHNHAAYLGHWIKLLQEEPKALMGCLRDAKKAADLICPQED